MRCLKFTMLLVIGLLAYNHCTAQSVSELKVLPSNLERYYIDYEIVGLSNPTQSDVAGLDLNMYEDMRLQSESITVVDVFTGYTLILYSINDSLKNWYGKSRNTGEHIEK